MLTLLPPHPFFFHSEVFCNQNKSDVLKEKEILRYPKLAETYRTIAAKGAKAFYEGPLAQNLVADIQAAGTALFYLTPSSSWSQVCFHSLNPCLEGIITMEDLRDYKAELDETPIEVETGEYKMVVPNAPASGPVLSLILNILNGRN